MTAPDPYAPRREGPLRRETDWTGKRVTVMGLGLFGGGLGAAAYALRLGADVTITDLRDEDALSASIGELQGIDGGRSARLVLGEHREDDFRRADIVIVNPAVPPGAPMLAVAREHCVRITTATELLLGGLDCRVVGITGTQGKSSTASFVAGLLDATGGPGTRTLLGGNIGGSLLGEIEALGREDVVVLEMSSYQLEHLSGDFLQLCRNERALDVAAITNIGVDHLARHRTREAYRAAKLRIAALVGHEGPRSGTVVVPGADRGALEPWPRVVSHDRTEVEGAETLRAPGAFQRKNLGTALAIGRALGRDPGPMVAAIPTLTGLPHRMESLGSFTDAATGRTIHVTDNGVSTTPESTVAALESLGTPKGTRAVLVGGILKGGCDVEALGASAAALGWIVVPFGRSAAELARAARAAGAVTVGELGGQNRDSWPSDVGGAVAAALAAGLDAPQAAASKADSDLHLLFSPACASFDRYPNFRARATAFRAALPSRGRLDA